MSQETNSWLYFFMSGLIFDQPWGIFPLEDAVISVQNLTYRYKTAKEDVEALSQLSLTINKGEWLAIIGPNGSGKSTLARHLNALLVPEEGTVTVEGMDTREVNFVWQIRQQVAFVFQNPDNQLVATTVEEDVAFGPENLGVPSGEIMARVDEALRCTGMEDYRDLAPHLLSGGQKQRVAIAGALAMRPAYLVLDEATSMLDPQGRQEVLQTLHRLNREMGLTVIFITHFMEEVAWAHRAVVMDQGGIIFLGTPREVFSRGAELAKIGLDVPEVAILAARLKDKGLIADSGILTVDEMVQMLCQLK